MRNAPPPPPPTDEPREGQLPSTGATVGTVLAGGGGDAGVAAVLPAKLVQPADITVVGDTGRVLRRRVAYFFLIAYALLMFVPFAWTVITSFKTLADSVRLSILPQPFTTAAWEYAINNLDPNIVRELLLPDAMNVALVSAHHPLASKREIALRELGDVPFLFMQRDFSPAFYDFILSAFERAQYTPVINAEYDGLPTVWTLAAQGMGWCLGSTSQIEYPPHGLVPVRIRDFDIPWGCELAYRRDEARPAVLEVIRELRDAARGMREAGMTCQETKYWPKAAQSA